MLKKTTMLIALLMTVIAASAQIMKTKDLEKYAKQRYGEKWLDAALNLSKGLTLDKNQSLTYQQIIECQGRTKQQLYAPLDSHM